MIGRALAAPARGGGKRAATLRAGAVAALIAVVSASCGRTSLSGSEGLGGGGSKGTQAPTMPPIVAASGGTTGSGGSAQAGAASGGAGAGGSMADGGGTADGGAGGSGGSVTVMARQWQDAVMLGHETTYGYAPAVAINEAGETVIAWRENAPAHDIWASRFVAATETWEPATVVPFTSGFVNFVTVGIDEDGSGALAIWHEQLELARFDVLSGLWSAETPKAPQDDIWPGFPAFSTTTRIIARWTENPNLGGDPNLIWTARYDAANGWGLKQTLDVQGADSIEPGGFDASPNGRAAAAWRAWYGSSAELYVAFKDEAEAWDSGVRLDDPGAGQPYGSAIAVVDSGEAMVVWSDGGSGTLAARHYDPATKEWQAPEQIGVGSNQKVCLNDSGEAIAVWNDWSGERKIRWNHFRDGQWQGAQPIERGPAGDAFEPDVAMNDSGQAVVVWAIRPPEFGAVPIIWASRLE